MISRTSRSPPVSLLTDLGLLRTSSSALFVLFEVPGLEGAVNFFVGVWILESEEGWLVAGISSQSSPTIWSFLRKKGHNLVSIVIESSASASEIKVGEDFIIAALTSDAGNALRFRDGVERDELAGVENNLSVPVINWNQSGPTRTYIHILSATPLNRPRRHRCLISSCPNFNR